MKEGAVTSSIMGHSEDGYVQVVVPLDRDTLRFFIEFEDPAGAMRAVLLNHAKQENVSTTVSPENKVIAVSSTSQTNAETRELPVDVLGQIEELIRKAPQSVGGYGVYRQAAQLAVAHFGKGWLKRGGRTVEESRILRSLERIVKSNVPEGHSNPYAPWSRFREYAKKVD